MVFKGRLSRKSLLARARNRDSSARFFATRVAKSRNARYEKRREEKKKTRPKLGGLEEIRLPPVSLRASVVSRVLLVSFPPQRLFFLLVSAVTRSSRLFSPALRHRTTIFLSSRGCSFTHARVSDQPRENTTKREEVGERKTRDETDVEAGTLQILKISSPLITQLQSLLLYISVARFASLFAS